MLEQLQQNLTLKIASVLIATGISFYVSSDTNSSVVGFSVPIELKNLPQNQVLVSPRAPQAQVSIKGPAFLVSRIATQKKTFKVSVPDGATNQFTLPLSAKDLGLNPEVRILSIEPPSLSVTLDKLVKKDVQVKVRRIGELPQGSRMADVEIQPARIILEGPDHEVRNIRVVETEPVDVSNVHETLERELKIILPPGTLSTVKPESVNYSIKIEDEASS